MENEIQAGGSPNPQDAKGADGSKPKSEPNIIFCRRVESKGEMVAGNPPKFINDGVDKITLPSPDEQIKGFYHEQAGRIISAMPKSYKRFEKKGNK